MTRTSNRGPTSLEFSVIGCIVSSPVVAELAVYASVCLTNLASHDIRQSGVRLSQVTSHGCSVGSPETPNV